MLLLFAAVDGAVSDREAGYVYACADALSALCDQDGLAEERPRTDAGDFVTRQGGAPTPTPAAKEVPAAAEKEEDAPPPEKLEDLLAELDSLCGLDKVKRDVKSLINLVKVRKLREEQGLPVPPCPSTWSSWAIRVPERLRSPGSCPGSTTPSGFFPKDSWWRWTAPDW